MIRFFFRVMITVCVCVCVCVRACKDVSVGVGAIVEMSPINQSIQYHYRHHPCGLS